MKRKIEGRCIDCGKKTSDYRCPDCWKALREEPDVDCYGECEYGEIAGEYIAC